MSVSVKVCLVALALAALVPATGGQVCRWGAGSGQGLAISSLDEGASRLAMLLNVTTMEECQERCCRDANCHLAMIGLPADGAPQCLLFSCLVQGRDVCVLQPNHQFTASRKVALTAEERVERNDTSTERCRRPRRVGPCRAAFPRVYYDVVNQTCTPFIYGGCQANDNHFYTLEECEEACSGVTGSVLPDESSPAPPTASPAPQAAARRMAPVQPDGSPLATGEEDEVRSVITEIDTSENDLPELSADDFAARCEATPEVGPCRASLRHWYYDRHTRSCQRFVYGGCHGNKNNYVSQENCMSACTVTVVPRGPARDDQTPMHYAEHCLGEADPGLCRAAFPMFFYHAASGTCRRFIYGGCGGNRNRFTTEEECMGSCAAGPDGQLGHAKRRDRWAPAFFLVGTLAIISALLLAALILITLRRVRLPHRASSHSDKEELLPELDENSSLEALTVPESPKPSKA